eukprot:5634536-Amphidinium_carterae.1
MTCVRGSGQLHRLGALYGIVCPVGRASGAHCNQGLDCLHKSDVNSVHAQAAVAAELVAESGDSPQGVQKALLETEAAVKDRNLQPQSVCGTVRQWAVAGQPVASSNVSSTNALHASLLQAQHPTQHRSESFFKTRILGMEGRWGRLAGGAKLLFELS